MPLTFDVARMQHGVHAKYGTTFHGDPPVSRTAANLARVHLFHSQAMPAAALRISDATAWACEM